MTRTIFSPQQRRKNARTAWLLAGLVLLVFVASIPFWRGLYRIAMGVSG